MIQIKRAEITDLELLLKWRITVLREVFSIADEKQIPELEQQNRLYYQKAIPAGEHIACFAYDGGEVVGCGGVCLHSEMPSPDNPNGKCAYLMNIYVLPSCRGQKTGKKIVTWLLQKAYEADAQKIYLESSECGQPLYRNLGFIDMPGIMKLPIG